MITALTTALLLFAVPQEAQVQKWKLDDVAIDTTVGLVSSYGFDIDSDATNYVWADTDYHGSHFMVSISPYPLDQTTSTLITISPREGAKLPPWTFREVDGNLQIEVKGPADE